MTFLRNHNDSLHSFIHVVFSSTRVPRYLVRTSRQEGPAEETEGTAAALRTDTGRRALKTRGKLDRRLFELIEKGS